MTDEAREQLMSERVRALATIILTRRGDLDVVETKKETGLDFHVYIDREDKPMRLMFGVLLRGVPSLVSTDQANKVLGPTMGHFQGMRKFTYPVCLFFFTMREDQAFFSWLAEPIANDGVPKLVHHTHAHCVELSNERLEEVVETIVSWYDLVESALMA